MNCYDCHALENTDTTAVAVCRSCGSGLCPGHLRLVRPLVHRPNGMGVSHGSTPSRQVLCTTCRTALGGGLPHASPA